MLVEEAQVGKDLEPREERVEACIVNDVTLSHSVRIPINNIILKAALSHVKSALKAASHPSTEVTGRFR